MPKLLLVGCGKMGGAMLAGWLKQGMPAGDIVIISPDECGFTNVMSFPSVAKIPAHFTPDIIIFAVKPQIMADVIPQYKQYRNATFLSIAAGKKITFFEEILGDDVAIIRTMPNLPATISKGVTACVANNNVTDEVKIQTTKLLQAIGVVEWVEDENLIDAITAISGSGPAYVFNFIEGLIQAGVNLGLTQQLAESLAKMTIYGSAELAYKSDIDVTTLRKNVTSPNGTTAAALDVLMQDSALETLLCDATLSAQQRSIEISEN